MPHNSLQLPSPHKPDPQHLCSVAIEKGLGSYTLRLCSPDYQRQNTCV